MSVHSEQMPAAPYKGLIRFVFVLLVILGALWFVWFDSYSLVRRAQWEREFIELREENAQLRAEIEDLQTKLATPVSDETIERIAREQYGMRRPEETVYRVEE